jgi:tetratricopeptide (TPR) repeat protein
MSPVRIVTLEQAVSQLVQVARDREIGRRRPYFFLTGAGMSHPPLPLAAAITQQCMEVASSFDRGEPDDGCADSEPYSYWFATAFPNPHQRQRYLRQLIEDKPISSANLRLAHLLMSKELATLVVTVNFDDQLERAATIFGCPILVCDHPQTVGRIDSDSDDLQLVHAHGSFWFYDLCNVTDEVWGRAQRSETTTNTMASLLDATFAHHTPMVLGYGGWEGDVVMQALKRRLAGQRLAYQLFWFCYEASAVKSLPDWLTHHPDVVFVMPAVTHSTVAVRDSETQESPSGVEASQAETQPVLTLPAAMVLEKLIAGLGLDEPRLTADPLGFFADKLGASVASGQSEEGLKDIYLFESVIRKIERANLFLQAAGEFEKQLERARGLIRRSQMKEACEILKNLNVEQMQPEELQSLRELLDGTLIWQGYTEGSSEVIFSVAKRLYARLMTYKADSEIAVEQENIYYLEGLNFASAEKYELAVESFIRCEELGRERGSTPDWIARATRWRANCLAELGSHGEALDILKQLYTELRRNKKVKGRTELLEILYFQGKIYSNINYHMLAGEAYLRGLELAQRVDRLFRSNFNAFKVGSSEFGKANEFEKALQCVEFIAKLDMKTIPPYLKDDMALSFARVAHYNDLLGRAEKVLTAAEELEQVCRDYPENVTVRMHGYAHYYRGRALELRGELVGAEIAYKQVLVICPADTEDASPTDWAKKRLKHLSRSHLTSAAAQNS